MEFPICPLCDGELETRVVGPCLCCGWESEEVEHHLTGIHGFAEYDVFDGMRIVLCDYCALDFGSQDPALFGLSPQRPIERASLTLRARLARPTLEEDGFCPRCDKRLAFLRFIAAARERHAPAG